MDKEGLHFVSFATVNWADVFVREDYFQIVLNSLDYCRKNKGLEIYCWCIMPSHVHLVMRAAQGNPDQVLGRLKEFTSKQLTTMISNNPKESRREWLMNMFEQAGKLSSNVKNLQFWQHHNKPIGVWSPEVIQQKVDYIHNNPVMAGFVFEPHHWKYSSAIDYSGGKGLLEMDFI